MAVAGWYFKGRGAKEAPLNVPTLNLKPELEGVGIATHNSRS
jgi:hypothetical protein